MRFFTRSAIVGLCALFVACAHAPQSLRDDHASPPLALTPRQDGPEVEALVAAFYEQPFDPKALHARVTQLLTRYPSASRVHEVAAYLALLEADSSAAIDHFLHAASDVDSALTSLYLFELAQLDTTAAEDDRRELLLRALIERHPAPAVRDRARIELASLLRSRLQLEAAAALTAPLHYIEDWHVIGAFDNDQGKGFRTTYAPESELDFGAKEQGKILPVRWRSLRADPSGRVDLDDWVAPNDYALAYLSTFVSSQSAGAGELRLTVSGAVKVWWNDRLVASEETIRAGAADNLVVPLRLERGGNKLLIKSCVRNSDWSLAARITGPDGKALPRVHANREPQQYTPDLSATKPAAISFVPPSVSELASSGRREFLSSRLAAMAGRNHDVLPPLERWLASVPDNALARYQISLGYALRDEVGKSIDALNVGARSYPDAYGFLLRRARYYRQKSLWDQALSDLSKISAADSAAGGARVKRDVQLELARVYKGRGFIIDQCKTLEALSTALPDLENAHLELAKCRESLGYAPQAEAELFTALGLAPGDAAAEQRAIDLRLQRLDFSAALDGNARLLAQYPRANGFALQRGSIERKRGDRSASRAFYESVRAQNPDLAVVYERLADLAYEEGRSADALADYQRALARNPRSVQLAERVATLDPSARGFAENLAPNDAQIDAILAAAPNVVVLPGSYTVRLLDHEVTEIANDGSAKRTETMITRAENQQAVDRMTKFDLPSQGTVRVLRAYSVSPNGDKQEASSITEESVRFRKLEPGSISVLQFVRYQPPGGFLPNHYASSWYFQSLHDQVEKAAWIVLHGPGRKLVVSIQGDVKQDIDETPERTMYTFTSEHMPPVVDEPFMPPASDVLAQVSLSTLNTWDEYTRWERALLSDAFRSSPELKALAARLTRDATTPRGKLEQLYRFVANDIRYQQEYESSIAGVRPHASPITLERGYGDCKDKAVLLIQLARLVDLKLQYALLRTTNYGHVMTSIPNRQFNHAIVYAPKQAGLAEPFFLDATAEALDIGNTPSMDQGTLALVIDPENGSGQRFIDIPYDAPDLQYEMHDFSIAISSPTKATAVDKLSARGGAAASIRHLLRNRAVADKTFQQVAAALFTGATLEKRVSEHADDVWQPLQIELDLDVSNAIQTQGDDKWRLPLPAYLPDLGSISLTSRRTPIHFGAHASVTYRIAAELPEGLRVLQAPASFEVEHVCLRASRHSEVVGRSVRVTLEYTRLCPDISVDDYAGFRQAALEVQQKLRDEIVFAREPAQKNHRPASAPVTHKL